MANKDNIALVHVHGQKAWHDDVYIVGNRAGLTVLHDAVNRALNNPDETASTEAFVSDGEGFELVIIHNDQPWQSDSWRRAAVPYTEEYARENRRNTVWPWNLTNSHK